MNLVKYFEIFIKNFKNNYKVLLITDLEPACH